jgi:hypothetical protein
MRFVDWKLYTSAALGALMGAFGIFAAATVDLVPILAIGTFLVLYLAFILVEFLWDQVKSRA